MNEDSKKIEAGKNIFLLDGPIGRLQFLKTFAIIFAAGLPIILVNFILLITFGITKYTQITYYTLWITYMVFAFYCIWIAGAKRLFDIIGEKDKAIFYIIIIWILHFTLPLIPFLKYTSVIVSTIINFILVLKQGKYIIPEQKETVINEET